MKQFIAQISKMQTDRVDPTLFDRTKEKSIDEYIISGLKVIESLPYIKFVSYKLIEDSSKFDIRLNRKHVKNKEIYKDKSITKIRSIKDTSYNLLKMNFAIDYEGEHRFISKELLIPAYVDKYHFLINGKEVLPMKQIVDVSTYNHKKSIKLKTTLSPVDLHKIDANKKFITTTDMDFTGDIKTFALNLFTKDLNPLYYFFPKFGVTRTIRYFSLHNIIDVTEKEYDNDLCHYFKINNKLYLEVNKYYFNESTYVRTLSYMFFDMMSKESIKTIDDRKYWTAKLGNIFTKNTKSLIKKGDNVLISFKRIFDDITKRTLRIDNKNLESTYSLVRWMIQNYHKLRKKDNHNLETKRVRCNEVTAFYFIQTMSQRINQLLNKKKLTIESIERIFNWNDDELFKNMLSSKSTLLKYDADINAFDMLNGLKVTVLGKQGVSGGKNINVEFRDVYASHLARLDLNGVSHGKNAALTGYLVPYCKLYGDGFFSKKSMDPDDFATDMRLLHNSIHDICEDIDERSKKLAMMKQEDASKAAADERLFVEGAIFVRARKSVPVDQNTGNIVIQPRNKPDNWISTHYDKDGVLVTDDGQVFIKSRKKNKRNNNEVIIIKRRNK